MAVSLLLSQPHYDIFVIKNIKTKYFINKNQIFLLF